MKLNKANFGGSFLFEREALKPSAVNLWSTWGNLGSTWGQHMIKLRRLTMSTTGMCAEYQGLHLSTSQLNVSPLLWVTSTCVGWFQ